MQKNLFEHSQHLTSATKSLTNPLSRVIGAEHFGYLRIYHNNSYYYLSNDSSITKTYLEQVRKSHIYCDQVLLKDPHSDLKLISWPSHPIEESMEIYLNHGYWGGLSVLNHQHPDYIEIWWVATNIKNNSQTLNYIKYSSIILGFIKHFNQRVISQIDFNQSILGEYSDGFEFNLGQVNCFDHQLKEARELVESMFPKGFEVRSRNGLIALTPRQTECLQLLSQGKSMKEMSRDLGVSCRTIEKHLSLIQHKLGYNLRSDLVKLFNEQLSYFKF